MPVVHQYRISEGSAENVADFVRRVTDGVAAVFSGHGRTPRRLMIEVAGRLEAEGFTVLVHGYKGPRQIGHDVSTWATFREHTTMMVVYPPGMRAETLSWSA